MVGIGPLQATRNQIIGNVVILWHAAALTPMIRSPKVASYEQGHCCLSASNGNGRNPIGVDTYSFSSFFGASPALFLGATNDLPASSVSISLASDLFSGSPASRSMPS
jgi:hypothetical protein